jgi:phosphoenolpyruvate-protein phosphotransferase (PTS system enzyme I)
MEAPTRRGKPRHSLTCAAWYPWRDFRRVTAPQSGNFGGRGARGSDPRARDAIVPTNNRMIRGTGVSSGIAQGTAYVLACTDRSAAPRRAIEGHEVDDELSRFEGAVARAEGDLLALKADVAVRIGASEAEIFAAQALVVRDHSFITQVSEIVRQKLVNAEAAVAEVIERFTNTFDQIADPYLRERAADIRDVGRRVLSGLIEKGGPEVLDIPAGSIVVTDELFPSTTARIELGRVLAFVTERGGKFSHTSILARSLRTPAVTGAIDAPLQIKTGDRLIVDGVSGLVFLDPDESLQREYARLEADLRSYKDDLQQLVDLPAITRDGTAIPLLANVSKFADTEPAFLYRADGIGLYRTEFGYSVRNGFPTEDEQYEFLKRAAERFHPRKVVFRLLDVGGDKVLSYFPLPSSRNPSLAQRGIRLLLKNPDILKRQLRAFLRISAEHPVSILMPVVGGLEEVRQTRQVMRQAMAELAELGVPFNRDIPLGAMIEIPAAAMLITALAREVDFFSLGTNDLVQYVLAADREDDTVADYYQPLHPAVLQVIHAVARAADDADRELTICGEMAGDPDYTELLMGLGLRAFSVAPGELLDVKNAIRKISLVEAHQLAQEALTLGSVAEVEALVNRHRHLGAAAIATAQEGDSISP